MNRNGRSPRSEFRKALLALGLTAAAVIPLVAPSAGCTSSTGTPACNALLSCCSNPNVDDPSSCTETAMSGVYTNAQCETILQMYQAGGACDGGIADAAKE